MCDATFVDTTFEQELRGAAHAVVGAGVAGAVGGGTRGVATGGGGGGAAGVSHLQSTFTDD